MNISKLHTTELGLERIRRNLGLETDDVMGWCREVVRNASDNDVVRRGKNYYVYGENFVLTVNAYSYTVITAHKQA
ncbi:MAG: DUF3781 domain-containing protein [Ruminococcus sp.]|nr:DUF3781 domain-containing protein [Ruminococcus sp.]